MGCGAPSKHEKSAKAAAAAVVVNVAELKAIVDKYFDEDATAKVKEAAIKEFAAKIKDIPADHARINFVFKSRNNLTKQYFELTTEVLLRFKAESKEYKAAKSLLNHYGFGDEAGCVDKLPGSLTFQGGEYDTKKAICDQIFDGVEEMGAGATAEEKFVKKSDNFREVFFSVDRLKTKMQTYIDAVGGDEDAAGYQTRVAAAYADAIKEMNGISQVDLTAKDKADVKFAENHMLMLRAIVNEGEKAKVEYKNIENVYGANGSLDIFGSLAECKTNMPNTGFQPILFGQDPVSTSNTLCDQMFQRGGTTLESKILWFADWIDHMNA